MQIPVTQRYTSTTNVEVFSPEKYHPVVVDLLISWRLIIVRDGANLKIRVEPVDIQGRVITHDGSNFEVNQLEIAPMAGMYDDDGLIYKIHRIDIHRNKAIIAL